MTGLVRNAAMTVACMLVASAAFAGVPSPTTSVVGSGVGNQRINLVGYFSGATDPTNAADSAAAGAKLTVTVKDLAGNVVAGSNVVLDFSGCTSDVKVGSVQSYHAETVGCSGVTVSNFTNASGVVAFTVIGGRSFSSAHAFGCAKVYADGVLLGSIGVGTYDNNNSTGVNLVDLSFWVNDYLAGTNPDRSDLNGSGTVNLVDLSSWVGTYLAGKSNTSSATVCP
jgi:hypothetical protein